MSFFNNPINNIIDSIKSKVPTIDINLIRNLNDVPYIENLPNFNKLPFISNGILYNYPDITPYIQSGDYTFLLNIIRSPISPPENKYNTYLTTLTTSPIYPPSLDLFKNINYPNAVKLQSGPTCSANSTACIKEYQAFVKNNYNNTFSPDYIYLNRSNQTTDGMYLSNAMFILKNKGACPSSNFPNGITTLANIPASSDIAAAQYKINNYSSIYQKTNTVDPNPSSTIDQIKSALYLHGPCLIAFMIYNYNGIYNPSTGLYDGRIWASESPSQSSLGGHCMTIVGYDAVKGFMIRNSWGPTWNGNGHAWLPYNDLGSVNEPFEIWTTTDLFSSSNKIINTPSIINNPTPSSNNSTPSSPYNRAPSSNNNSTPSSPYNRTPSSNNKLTPSSLYNRTPSSNNKLTPSSLYNRTPSSSNKLPPSSSNNSIHVKIIQDDPTPININPAPDNNNLYYLLILIPVILVIVYYYYFYSSVESSNFRKL